MIEASTALAPAPEIAGPDGPWRPRRRPNARKTSHLLAAGLRRQVLAGELVAGQRLPPEAELTAAFEVSRDTLREALRILESQSLLEVRRGRGGGAVVRRPGLTSVRRYVALLLQVRRATLANLEEARSLIEPPAAEQFAARCGDDDLDRLVGLHDDERAAEGEPLSFATAVTAFDQAVTELSGNRSLAVFAGVLRDIYAGHVYAAVGASEPATAGRIARRVVVGHSAFLDAARRRDATLAKEAWSDYLFSTSRLMVSRSRSRQPVDVVPLWKAQAWQVGAGEPRRMATEVATEVRSRIADGRLRDGDRLPSLAELAREFGISRPTLREALRVLETEFLLDLRTGDRGGAIVRHPSTDVAAQLAGIVLEARQATLGDFYRAQVLIEPPMMELAASRIGARPLRDLRAVAAELAASAEDTARFVPAFRRGGGLAIAATRNPALAVVAEMLEWVRVGTEQAVAAGATDIPGVVRSNRRAQERFTELVEAFATRDTSRAGRVWSAVLEAGAPFVEASELGRRLMIDLIE